MTPQLLQLIAKQHIAELESVATDARLAHEVATQRCAQHLPEPDCRKSPRLARLRARLRPARA